MNLYIYTSIHLYINTSTIHKNDINFVRLYKTLNDHMHNKCGNYVLVDYLAG